METAIVTLYEGKMLIPERVNDLLKVTKLVIELALRPNFLTRAKVLCLPTNWIFSYIAVSPLLQEKHSVLTMGFIYKDLSC